MNPLQLCLVMCRLLALDCINTFLGLVTVMILTWLHVSLLYVSLVAFHLEMPTQLA